MSTGTGSPVPSTLGSRIADCREHLGWTQKALAERAELSVTFLSEVENDRRVPGTDALRRLADALDTTLDYLVKGATGRAPERKPMVIPAELEALAVEAELSFSDTATLMKYKDMVVARRGGSASADEQERRLTPDQWRQLLEWMRQRPF